MYIQEKLSTLALVSLLESFIDQTQNVFAKIKEK